MGEGRALPFYETALCARIIWKQRRNEGPDFDARRATMRAQQLLEERTVLIAEKPALAPLAALRDMMGNAGAHDARKTGHAPKMASAPSCVKKCAVSVTPKIKGQCLYLGFQVLP